MAAPMDVGNERDHSVLDELGLGRGSAVPGREAVNEARMGTPNRAWAYPRADLGDPDAYPIDPLNDPLAVRDPAVNHRT